MEAVARIDALFAFEREINGLPSHERVRERNERSRPSVIALQAWLRSSADGSTPARLRQRPARCQESS
jgi:hypothetical protein